MIVPPEKKFKNHSLRIVSVNNGRGKKIFDDALASTTKRKTNVHRLSIFWELETITTLN